MTPNKIPITATITFNTILIANNKSLKIYSYEKVIKDTAIPANNIE